jgi:hypothetical protein
MEKVVPFFKTFTTIFYLNFFKPWKVVYGSVKLYKVLNFFESV